MKKRLVQFHIVLFVLLLNFQFFRFNIVSQLYIAWCIITVIVIGKTYGTNFRTQKKEIVIAILWFVPVTLSVLYSSNTGEALNGLKKMLPILITPFVLFPLQNEHKKTLLAFTRNIFPISTLLFGLYIIVKLCIYFYEPYVIQYGKPTLFTYLEFVYNHRFSYINEKANQEVILQFFHKTYYGIAVLISMFLLAASRKKISVLLIMLLAVMLLIFRPVPQLIIAVLFLGYLLLKKVKAKYRNWLLITGACCFLAAGFFTKDRIVSMVKEKTSDRAVVYNCGLGAIKKAPVLGYGIGDVQETLRTCYAKNNCTDCHDLNAHNQYFNILLCAGIPGLLLFLYMGVVAFRSAYTTRSVLFFFFLMAFFVSFFFENILSRMWGVLMFSLFYGIFYFEKITYSRDNEQVMNHN